MCDFSGKLIAWMDRELGQGEATEIERHVQNCAECRACASAYRAASREFDEYCEEVLRLKECGRGVRGVPVLWRGAAAAAGILALVLVFPRARVEQPLVQRPAIATSPVALTVGAGATETVPAAAVVTMQRAAHSRHSGVVEKSGAVCCATTTAQSQAANWVADDPAIQIAIPADAIFPPGSFPEGVNFVADLSIAADGSAEQLRLLPRFGGVEGRTSQP
jgi:hypothetical protein